MNDLMEEYRAQIAALRRELERKDQQIANAKKLITELYEAMKAEHHENFVDGLTEAQNEIVKL